MTHLHSVRLRGFKTFARPTELIFESGVTVIIGPNGSGKSNIADAVLWVLGEQSPGNLRGRSMQDVIFSGPDGRKSSAVAEVSLVFDNECGSLPLDCSQVEVTRRLLRDGGSEYLVNGAGCRLLDVQDLVGGLGLGREMHSVISQGKVEALLNSTPEARRALVEEAAGLGRFKKRRERAQAKLERTRQNLLRVSDVEREVKAALRPLKQQVVAAERFAEATEAWALAKAKWVLLALTDAQNVCRETEGELAGLQARRVDLETRLAELRRQRAAEEDHFTGALREREELNAAYHRARAAAERVEGRAVSLRQRVARMEGELDRALRRRELAQSELDSLMSRLQEVTAGTVDESRLQTVGTWAQSLRTALEDSLPAYRAAAAAEDDLKDTVFEVEAARSRALQDRDFLRREAEEKGRVGSELAALSRAATTRLERMRAEAAGLDRQRVAGETALDQAGEALKAAVSLREEVRSSAEEAAREEMSIGDRLAGLESRQAILQDLLRRREGISAGARELMTAVDGARLLTEVLTVEPGYERAFAAALGPVAQAVVVSGPPDTGRALHVEGPLEAIWESQPPARPSPPTSPPAGSRDLWELVSGPETVTETLRALMPPTAVLTGDGGLEDAASGEERGSWRLVNRAGELAEGALHVARRQEVGAETLLKARNELGSLAEEHAALLVRRDMARKSAEEGDAALTHAQAHLREREEDLREAERRLAAQKNESDLHARRLEESEAQCAELRGRQERESGLADQILSDLRAVDEAMVDREAELEEARVALRALQARLEAMRKTVAGLEEKKGQAALLEVRLRERCRAHESERERARVLREAALVEAARCERRVAFLHRYVPVLTELLSVVERLAERSHVVATGLESHVEEARALSEGAAKVIRDWGGAEAELQREHDGMTTRLTQLQVDQARLDDRRSSLESESAELRRRHLSPRTLTSAEIVGEDADTLSAAVERSERRWERIGPVNPLAEQECAEMEERARFLGEQRRDLEASLSQLQDVITELDEHIERVFAEIFEDTRENFTSVIATVFPGAKGTLRLTENKPAPQRSLEAEPGSLGDAEDGDEGGQETRGIALEVKLPNKAPRSMSLLSGGEKAMAAIAFLFSLFLARPCPFYILDEVEASLDDLNIRRFLSLIRKYRDKTQFIIITHQRQTMEVADTLYGVALEGDGTSRVLSRRLGYKKDARNRPGRPEAVDLMPKGA
ncbi:MAG: chromosome segregation protein SMC [bacterium]